MLLLKHVRQETSKVVTVIVQKSVHRVKAGHGLGAAATSSLEKSSVNNSLRHENEAMI